MEITKIKIGSSIYDIKDVTSASSTGSTNSSEKLFIVGATSQSQSTKTYSNSNCYVGPDNCLYSNGSKVLTTGSVVGDGDTKNTTGTTNLVDTKLFLAGATIQSTNPQTYSNSNCYIGADNCLYTNGNKTVIASDVTDAIYTELYGSTIKPQGAYVITNLNLADAAQDAGITGGTGGDGDTKNTAGATNNTGTKLFLVGSASQDTNPQTYTNKKCYIGTDNYLYTNGSKTTTDTDVTNAINTELYNSTTKPNGAYAITNQNLSSAISSLGLGGVSNYYQLEYAISRINGSGTVNIPGTNPVYLVNVSDNISSVVLSTNPPYGHSCHVIFKSANNTAHTVIIGNDSINRICPDGSDISLDVPASGYVEVDFLNMGDSTVGNEVYVRGI